MAPPSPATNGSPPSWVPSTEIVPGVSSILVPPPAVAELACTATFAAVAASVAVVLSDTRDSGRLVDLELWRAVPVKATSASRRGATGTSGASGASQDWTAWLPTRPCSDRMTAGDRTRPGGCGGAPASMRLSETSARKVTEGSPPGI